MGRDGTGTTSLKCDAASARMTRKDQVGPAGSAFPKAMLAQPDPLFAV